MQHTLGRFFLPTFNGSPKSRAKAWVKKLDTYFQLHQVSEDEALRVAEFHLEGKAYAWLFFETYSLNHVNVSTYAKFTRRLVKKFDVRNFETSLVELAKPKKTKPLHELEGSINPTPF